MKWTIGREALVSALQAVAGAIQKKGALEILSHVRMEAADGQLTLTGTDLEMQLQSRCPVAGDDGATTLPHDRLLSVCKLLEAAEVELTVGEGRAVLKAGRSRHTLPVRPAEDFPAFEPVQNSGLVNFTAAIPADLLRMALGRTVYAAAVEDVRFYLKGANFIVNGKTLTVAASDGHRMAVFVADWVFEISDSREFIVPRESLLELQKLISGASGEIALTVDGTALYAQIGPVGYATKLIDGRFPDYNRVMPRAFHHVVTVGRAELMGVLKRAALPLASEKFKSISLSLDLSGEMVARGATDGEKTAEESMAVTLDDGGAWGIGCNADYLLAALGQLPGDRARLSMPDGLNSILIEDPDDGSTRHVVMPVRL